jgi:hypothetical protein
MNDQMPPTSPTSPIDRQTVVPSTERKTIWRVINLAMIVVGFMGPWFSACGSTPSTGFQTVQITVGFLSGPADVSFKLMMFLGFIGLICILAYCGENLFRAIVRTTVPIWTGVALARLAAGGIGIAVGLPFIGMLRWGYALTWVGWGSCV